MRRNKLMGTAAVSAAAVLMAVSLTACEGSETATTTTEIIETTVADMEEVSSVVQEVKEEASSELESVVETLVSEWDYSFDETIPDIPEDAKAVFDKASSSLVGGTYTPIAYLGSQVVNGTNHLFLCKGNAVTPTSKEALYLVKVYEGLDGNTEISSIEDFNLETAASIEETAESEQLAGGWTPSSEYKAINLPDEIETAFETVIAEYENWNYEPVYVLAVKDNEGNKEYAILCHSTEAEQGQYVIVRLSVSADGAPAINGITVVQFS